MCVCVCLPTDEHVRALGQTSSLIAEGLRWKQSATNAVPQSEVRSHVIVTRDFM